MKSLSTPTETYQAPSSVQISTYPDEYDIFIPAIKTTVPVPSTTVISTSTLMTPSSTELKTTFPSTTITLIMKTTPSTTLSSTTTSTMKPLTTTTTPATTENIFLDYDIDNYDEKPALPTMKPRTSTLQTTLSAMSSSSSSSTNILTSTEKMFHRGNSKNHGKNRKQSHKKHHRQHPPVHELDDIPEGDPNLELKTEKNFEFDSFDREIHMVDNASNRRKKGKAAGGQIKAKTTQKTITEATRQSSSKAKTRDSEIHKIAKPFEPSTVDSKVIEIKSKATTDGVVESKRVLIKRSLSDNDNEYGNNLHEDDVILLDSALPSINEDIYIIKEERKEAIYPEALIGAITNFTQTNELEGIGGFLQSIFGTDDKFDPKYWFQKSPSLEFLNLALALLVWSVRYPSVFWDSSKAFTMIFSLQMIINSIDILMLHVGTSILFKLQIAGQFMTFQNQPSPLLLNGIVTLALTLLAYVLIIASSMILYLYGHSRLSSKIRDCQMITLKDGDLWSYFSHCASLCFILGISVVKAPIIHDLSVVYRISLDKTIFTTSKCLNLIKNNIDETILMIFIYYI